MEHMFAGSLPRFLTAFCSGRKLSLQEAEEMRRLIDENLGGDAGEGRE